ncbi:extracellular solute-binding protein [Allopusillimonas ginsengisoli]|nr:extracellular solute-binding protein [Allopusillimonas ginsengisoli]
MDKFDRRYFLKLAGAAGVTSLAGGIPLARAADAALMDKAKAQGQAVFYANITAVEPIMKAFEAATGVKGKYTRISSSKFIPTVLTEFNAGKLLADVVQAPLPMLQLLKEQGVLAPYHSPSLEGYPEWATADDAIVQFGIEYVSYLYNTDHVKKADAPARYEDLADPKWKGKIVMANPSSHASTIGWLVGLKEKVFKSEDDWMQYLKGLAANNPMFVASFGPTPAPVESGEKLIAISMPKYIVTKAPAPLAWGPQSGQPLLGSPRAIALATKSPHPDAAKVFLDYWLSKEAMSILASKVGEYVLAPGVHPPIEGMDKADVQPVRDLSDDELTKWGREFGKIFAVR